MRLYNLAKNCHSRTFATSRNRFHEKAWNNERIESTPRTFKNVPKARKIEKTRIPQVQRIIAVSSAKGGVGKSTLAVNLAMSLALHESKPKVGLLDLDIFGPSIPKLMGLENQPSPDLNQFGHMIPLVNHGIHCMSMGFLLPDSPDSPVVWRGLMVQKAAQQLLFEVDWSCGQSGGLDVLVIDLPPGTGDVALTLGQLVRVDGAVIVSTPQDVALADVRKGISMFNKIDIPILGMVLNMAYFRCTNCKTDHEIFGLPDAAGLLGVPIIAKLPILPQLSFSGDRGIPISLAADTDGAEEVKDILKGLGSFVLNRIR